MDIIAAYQQVGSFRGAAGLCGTTHKTVKRVVDAHQAAAGGEPPAARSARARNFDQVADLVAQKVKVTEARISAKRLLPVARAAGYQGSARNFRRLVAEPKRAWRTEQPRAGADRRCGCPGRTWSSIGVNSCWPGGRCTCSARCWPGPDVRFVRFATDQQQATTLGLLAECFDVLGGVPKIVLADRMGCLKGGVVANVVVPTPDYVRFAAHYGFRPDFCHADDPESKGIVENLVGYAKRDLIIPLELEADPWAGGLAGLNAHAADWCAEVNRREHSEICAVPAERLETEHDCWAGCRRCGCQIGPAPVTRKVDRLSCVRFASARYSVPNRLIGTTVTVLIDQPAGWLTVIEPGRGWCAEHRLVAPGETSIRDDHYDRPRPDKPRRAPATPHAGREAVLRARAGRGGVPDRRCRGRRDPAARRARPDPRPGCRSRPAGGVGRAGPGGRVRPVARRRRPLHPGHRRPRPHSYRPAGQALVLTLPAVPTRSLAAYRIDGGEPA